MGRGGRSLSPPLALSFSLCLPTIDNEKQRRRTLTPLRLSSPLSLSLIPRVSLSSRLSRFFPLYPGPAAKLACSTIPRWFLLSTAAPTKDTRVYIASLIQCRNSSSNRRQAFPRSSATRETHDARSRDVSPVARYAIHTARFAARFSLVCFDLV